MVVVREEGAQTTVEVPQLFGVPVEIPQVQFLDKFDTPIVCNDGCRGSLPGGRPVFGQVRYMSAVVHFFAKVVDDLDVLCNGVLQGQFIDGNDVPIFTRRLCRPCDHAETLCAVNSPLTLQSDGPGCAGVGVMRHASHLFFDKVVDVPVLRRCSSSTVLTSTWSCAVSAQLLTWQFDSVLGIRLGVRIVPASGSSSELSSHQMAIHSHPGVQKMPANGISSELSAHQMARPGAIAHSRAPLCPRASTLSFPPPSLHSRP